MKKYAILSAMKTVFVLLVLALAVGFYGQPAQAIPLTPVINNGSFENTTGFVPDYRDSMELNGGSTTITGWLVTGRQYSGSGQRTLMVLPPPTVVISLILPAIMRVPLMAA